MLRLTILRNACTRAEKEGRFVGVTDESLPEEEKARIRASLPAVEMEAAFCSPMKRCRETASLLCPMLEIREIPELKQCDYGAFENKNYQDLQGSDQYRKWMIEGGLDYPDGENRVDFRERCLKGLEALVKKAYENEWQDVLLVVPEDVMRVLLTAYGFPRAAYESWTAEGGEGYRVRFQPDAFLDGKRELVVDQKRRLF